MDEKTDYEKEGKEWSLFKFDTHKDKSRRESNARR